MADFNIPQLRNRRLSSLLADPSVMDTYQPRQQGLLDPSVDAIGPPTVLGGLLSLDPTDYVGPQTLGKLAAGIKGLLAGGAAMGGMIRTPVGRIPQNGSETRSLAEMLKRAGERAGYDVSHSGSAISPSQYVTFRKIGDETDELTRQVRLSNHADKYPELAQGVRTSVDPEAQISFEQAVNWLGRSGFPTSLSKKYKDVPTWEQYYAAKKAADYAPEERLEKMRRWWLNQPKATRGDAPTMDDVSAGRTVLDLIKRNSQ